ncbi:uncharacterized protein DEA37_0010777 [Paragonimus westermani]|uniref:Uncharacterized protein n=1 Tax=Paragonimus westermani TaxID=34504 RepID=A0A5J4N927_9TREM|nr:uncharacterized protein DEA37_0010777 [Paragonimus westermani]
MELPPSSPFRQRNSSFTNLQDSITPPKDSIPVPPSAFDDSDHVLTNPTRFRRSSFALSGERQTTLDDLIVSASLQANTAAATREAAQLRAIVSSGSDNNALEHSPSRIEIGSDSEDSELFLKRMSVATIVPNKPTVTVFSDSDPSSSGSSDGVTDQLKQSRTGGTVSTTSKKLVDDESKENVFVWHNTNAFRSNPLTSDLVRKYLASLVTDDNSPLVTSPISTSPVRLSLMQSENLPGVLSFHCPTVASMTMPVHRTRRAHKDSAGATRSPNLHSPHQPNCKVSTLAGRWTDVNSSSDTDAWYGWHRQGGYLSDNPLLNFAASEAKLLRLAGQRLEADFHRSTASLPRSPKRGRTRSGNRAVVRDQLFVPGTTPSSPRSSRFDFSHVYDGLPPPRRPKCELSTSSGSLNLDQALRTCLTPPSTPLSEHSAHGSTIQLSSNPIGMRRFRSLFDHLKPQSPSEDSEKYIYLDEKTRERRAEAQASNVISPVSF